MDFHIRKDRQQLVTENARTFSGGIEVKSLGYWKVVLQVDLGIKPSGGYQNVRV